jgi:hypothetical protein
MSDFPDSKPHLPLPTDMPSDEERTITLKYANADGEELVAGSVQGVLPLPFMYYI